MDKRLIEINGTKFEVDLSSAKRIDEFKVGDVVKILKKEYSTYKSYAGTIVGFDNFKTLPTIIIAYLEESYDSADIKYVYYNSQIEDVEICAANPNDICFDANNVVDKIDMEINNLKDKINELERKKQFFIEHYNKCFGEFKDEVR